MISVSDTGVGIAAAALPNIFDMFMQADDPTGQPRDGLGIRVDARTAADRAARRAHPGHERRARHRGDVRHPTAAVRSGACLAVAQKRRDLSRRSATRGRTCRAVGATRGRTCRAVARRAGGLVGPSARGGLCFAEALRAKANGRRFAQSAMFMSGDTLAIILGGGQGSRLFPLTATRSKPAVPIGGKCTPDRRARQQLSARGHPTHLRPHAVQFGVAQPPHLADLPPRHVLAGFVEILAAEQTPDNPNWFQGTADAVRQAARHFAQHEAHYYLILAGDHLYRMDYSEHDRRTRTSTRDITIAAQPVDPDTATQMGIFRFDVSGNIVAFEEKPKPDRLKAIGRSIPPGATFGRHTDEQPFMASMGIYVFSRDILLQMLEREPGLDFGRELIPNALNTYRVKPYCVAVTGPTSARSNRFTRPTSCSAARPRRSGSGIPGARSTRTRATWRARA